MFYTLSKLGYLLIRPSNFVVAAMVVALVLRGTRFRRTARGAFVVGFAVLLIGGWTGAATLLIAPLEDRFPRPTLPEEAPTGIIVLGGAIDTGLSTLYGDAEFVDGAERLVATAALARRYPSARIIISGGQGDGTGPDRPEADVTADLLEAWGISRSRMVLERASRNTRENAVMSYDIVEPARTDRWILVTSAFHMPRAIGCFRAAGWTGLTGYPVDYRGFRDAPLLGGQTAAQGLELLDGAVKEWIGLAAYRFGGYTDAVFPAP